MSNFIFMLWLLLFPVAYNLASFIMYQERGKQYKDSTWILAGFIKGVFYFYVAYLLYVPK